MDNQANIVKLESEVKDLKDGHQDLQITIIKSLGDIDKSLSNLGLKLDNEIKTINDFRHRTDREMTAIRKDMAVMKVEIIDIDKKQAGLVTTQKEYKDIMKFLRKSLIGVIIMLMGSIGTIAAIFKGLI